MRELGHPDTTIEDHDVAGHLLIRFVVPGSKFGSLEVVFSHAEAETLATDILDAIAFAEASE